MMYTYLGTQGKKKKEEKTLTKLEAFHEEIQAKGHTSDLMETR